MKSIEFPYPYPKLVCVFLEMRERLSLCAPHRTTTVRVRESAGEERERVETRKDEEQKKW